MRSTHIHKAFIAFTVILTLFLGACNTLPLQAGSGAASDLIQAVATTGMVADLVRAVGGERVQVTALMGPGVDPHLYRATARNILTLQSADIIFYSGLHLEARLADIFERLAVRLPTVAIGEATPPEQRLESEDYPGLSDPHIWFDVSLWSKAVTAVEESLIALDPAHQTDYEARAEAFRTRLAALDAYTLAALRSVPESQRLMITAHDAFRYFGRRYGLEVTGLQGISTESEAGVGDVRRLVDLVVERKIPAIFVETSIPLRAIEAVIQAARARGQEVRVGGELFSDAMGDEGTPQGTYIGMILHNTAAITTALGGTLPPLPVELADYQPLIDAAVASHGES